MITTGLDRLLRSPQQLAQRRYGLLSHPAAVTSDLRPIHLALEASPAGAPDVLFGPEHGFYAMEQDMVAAQSGQDPWTGAQVLSLYGDSAASLHPQPEAFAGLDLLLIDLQDVGARYYTYAATAIWSARVALAAGCSVWVLDRPNPLGGTLIEGNLPEPGYESFVGAFRLPVRHGMTLGELVLLEARREGWDQDGLRIWPMEGWRRHMTWEATGRPWIAPSPNMPSLETARVYPGACLVEATELSEGRGTTRPFQLVGAPHLNPVELAARLTRRRLDGVSFLPTYFRPQFQKHAGQVCGGVEIVVTDPETFRPYRFGVELLAVAHQLSPRDFLWRENPYEFVAHQPAIDLLTRGEVCRRGIEAENGRNPRGNGNEPLQQWMASWDDDEESFRKERSGILLYPETEERKGSRETPHPAS